MIGQFFDVMIGTGTLENAYRPSCIDKYPDIKMSLQTDIDTFITEPNVVAVLIQADNEIFNTILDDPGLEVIWYEQG